jgi:hypothetical protein
MVSFCAAVVQLLLWFLYRRDDFKRSCDVSKRLAVRNSRIDTCPIYCLAVSVHELWSNCC